jgi:hypothetical protein
MAARMNDAKYRRGDAAVVTARHIVHVSVDL